MPGLIHLRPCRSAARNGRTAMPRLWPTIPSRAGPIGPGTSRRQTGLPGSRPCGLDQHESRGSPLRAAPWGCGAIPSHVSGTAAGRLAPLLPPESGQVPSERCKTAPGQLRQEAGAKALAGPSCPELQCRRGAQWAGTVCPGPVRCP